MAAHGRSCNYNTKTELSDLKCVISDFDCHPIANISHSDKDFSMEIHSPSGHNNIHLSQTLEAFYSNMKV